MLGLLRIKDFGAWVLVSMVNCEFDAAQACIERLVMRGYSRMAAKT
jgi:hypothetical protein